MKVLLIQPNAPLLYWKLPKLCRLSGKKALYPPLGLITVAALLPSEWELRLVDLEIERLTSQDWEWADMVMISGMVSHRPNFLALVREAKQRGKIVVAGGPYPSSDPDQTMEAGCDFLIKGEAENTLPLFLTALKEGRRGVILDKGEKPDLSASPIPRFDLLKLPAYMTLGIQTSRGCPYACEFCNVSSLFGRKSRIKETSQVLAELQTLYDLGWRREIFICDDNFIGNRAQAVDLLQQLIPWMQEHGNPYSFWTQTSVDLGQDLEMIDLMTRANFGMIFIGVETPEEEALAAAHKFQNLSHSLVETVNNITTNGLGVMVSLIIGLDGEKPGTGERIRAFVEETATPLIMLNFLVPLPGTKLWQRLRQEGRLLEDRFDSDLVDKTLSYVPTRPEAEIMEEYFHLWEYLYEPRHFLKRAYQFILRIRPTRAAMAKTQGTPQTPRRPAAKEHLRDQLYGLRTFLALCWRRGVLAPYRWQYWRQFWGVYRQNPSRLVKYLKILAMGEDMFNLRTAMLKTREDYHRPL